MLKEYVTITIYATGHVVREEEIDFSLLYPMGSVNYYLAKTGRDLNGAVCCTGIVTMHLYDDVPLNKLINNLDDFIGKFKHDKVDCSFNHNDYFGFMTEAGNITIKYDQVVATREYRVFPFDSECLYIVTVGNINMPKYDIFGYGSTIVTDKYANSIDLRIGYDMLCDIDTISKVISDAYGIDCAIDYSNYDVPNNCIKRMNSVASGLKKSIKLIKAAKADKKK